MTVKKHVGIMPDSKRKDMRDRHDMDWQEDAACASVLKDPDPELDLAFFPGRNRADIRWIEVREKFCRGCPVREECLEYGLKYRYPGIWGGEIINKSGNIATTKYGTFEARARKSA
jgi:hypothetical protein